MMLSSPLPKWRSHAQARTACGLPFVRCCERVPPPPHQAVSPPPPPMPSELLDPAAGWLMNDTLLLQCEVWDVEACLDDE